MTLTVFDYLILTGIEFSDFIFPFLLVSIDTIYRTLKTSFNYVSTHLEARQKYIPLRAVFSAIFSVFREMWSNTFFRVC